MEIATIMQQPIMTELQQAMPAGAPNSTAPVPDGLFAMFFMQKLNMTEPRGTVGTLLSPMIEGVVTGEVAEADGEVGEEISLANPGASAELQAMAMMNMVQQSLVNVAQPPAPSVPTELTTGDLPEVSSVTSAGPVPVMNATEQHTQSSENVSPERETTLLQMPMVKASDSAMPKADATEQKAPERKLEAQSVSTTHAEHEKPEPTARVSTVPMEPRWIEPSVTAVPEQQKAATEQQNVAGASEVETSTSATGQLLSQPLTGVKLKAEGHQQKEPMPEMVEAGTTEGASSPEITAGQMKQGADFSSGEEQEQHLPGEKVQEASPSSTPMAAELFKVPEQNRYQAATQPVAEQPPVPEHEHIMAQVKEKLALHEVTPGKGEISFTLHPEELGELKITMRMDDNRLKVEIVAQNQIVREALVQNIEGLRESLSRQSITVDRFDVSTGGGSFNEAFREGKQAGQNGYSHRYPQYGATRSEQEQKTVTYWQPREDSLVDVRF